ncbi:MAG: DUF4296 domain-containing protein [Bacteroidota bacterium]
MKRIFYWTMGLICLLGCKEKVELSIDKDKFAVVLRDIHIAEAAANDIPDTKLKDSVLQVFYQQVYDMHGVDSTLIHDNINLMRTDPVLSREVYTKVLDELNSLSFEEKK